MVGIVLESCDEFFEGFHSEFGEEGTVELCGSGGGGGSDGGGGVRGLRGEGGGGGVVEFREFRRKETV